MITIRQATLADKAAIFDFLRLAYAGRWEYKFPHRWEWAFERNPFWEGEGLPVWIAVDGPRVVGQSAALVEPLVIRGREYRVGWGVDFFVLPEYRGQGIGTRLQAANNAGHEVFMSLSMARSAAVIKSRIGLRPLPPVPVFTRILRHEPDSVLRTLAARTRLPAGLLRLCGAHRLAAGVLHVRDGFRDRVRRPRPVPGVELIPVEVFTEEVDALWQAVSPHFAALVRREAEYLNWKFCQQPHMRHQKAIARREGEVCGYVVFRRARPPERNAGVLVDLFARPDDEGTLCALAGYALARLREQGVSYVTAASSVPAIQACLLALGFKQSGAAQPMVRAGVDVPQQGWLLGKGDHDWDQYPLA